MLVVEYSAGTLIRSSAPRKRGLLLTSDIKPVALPVGISPGAYLILGSPTGNILGDSSGTTESTILLLPSVNVPIAKVV